MATNVNRANPLPNANAQPNAAAAAAANPIADAFNRTMAVAVNTSSLSSGITSLTGIVSARQKRLAEISVAIANAANQDPALSQVALARLNMEMSTAQNLNDQTKKLHDSLERSISTWTRP